MSFSFKVPYRLEHVEISTNEEFYNIYTYKIQYLSLYLHETERYIIVSIVVFFNISKCNVHVHINDVQLQNMLITDMHAQLFTLNARENICIHIHMQQFKLLLL